MTDRETAIIWLDSFVKNKDPFTLIPKQLIRLMHDVLKEQPNIVRCKDCRYGMKTDQIAEILNRINDALEGTKFEAVGFDNTGEFLLVMIDRKGGEEQ